MIRPLQLLLAAAFLLEAGPFSVSRLDTSGYMGEWVVSDFGKDDRPFIAYYDFDIKGVKTLKCGNAACDSGNVFNSIDTVGLRGWFIAVGMGGDGRPLLSYFDVTREELRVTRCGNAQCTENNRVTVADSAGEVGRFSSIAIRSDGRPVLSYNDEGRRDLKLMFCGDSACAGVNTFLWPDTAGDVGQHTSLAIDAGDRPVVSYFDATRGDLKVLKCGNPACTAGNTVSSVDTAGEVGQFGSMVLGKDGLPIIVYRDGTHGRLKLAKCGDAACTSGNVIRDIVAHESVSGRPSLALDPAGHPVVTYHSRAGEDLKAVRCGDATCSSGNTYHLIDAEGEVGLYSSLDFDSAGRPFIAYFDQGRYDLKAAHCVGMDCWSPSATGMRLRPGLPRGWGRNAPDGYQRGAEAARNLQGRRLDRKGR